MDNLENTESRLVAALRGQDVHPCPVWFMRQAGRYLPEYRKLRKKTGGFLELCYTPELAIEATMQPMRRYAFDASIIFSDILVVPDALGQKVWFIEGEGPRLQPITDVSTLSFEGFEKRLLPVYEAVRGLRASLPPSKAVIGFCGAPWTLATYMIAGRGGNDQWPARTFALQKREAFADLIDLLVVACTRHLIKQIEAGADALQIFDSWASALDEEAFTKFCLEPIARIVAGVREQAPYVPIIGFPRGAGFAYEQFARESGVDGVSLDWTTPMYVARALQTHVCVQGNLDPARLAAGGEQLDRTVARICRELRDGPFIFNLGHGISLETPPDHVTRVVDMVHELTR